MFSSRHKYLSGTGWPSFYQPAVEGNVETNIDRKYGMTRTEVHCSKVCIKNKTLSKQLLINLINHVLVQSSHGSYI